MIQLERGRRILFATQAVDFRKSFDGLCGVVRHELSGDPVDGSIFVFYNRRRDRVKLLVWDDDGFWLLYKRLETGTFELPRIEAGQSSVRLSNMELDFVLRGIVLDSVRRRKRYAKILTKQTA